MSYGNGACRKWPRKRQASAYGTRGDSHHIAATPASAYSSVSAWASGIRRWGGCVVKERTQAAIVQQNTRRREAALLLLSGRRADSLLPCFPSELGRGSGGRAACRER